jgi:hypothetical protein
MTAALGKEAGMGGWRNRLRRGLVWTALAGALAAGLAACGNGDNYADLRYDSKKLDDIRTYTDRFKEYRVALAEHYTSGFVCASGDLPPDQGAAGVHLGNYNMIRDHVLDPKRPEILIYMPTETDFKLVAVEYVVPDYGQKAPTVLGAPMHRVNATDIPGFKLALPPGQPPFAWYIHMWLYEKNPRGLFADGNPNLRCPPPPAAFQGIPPAVSGSAAGYLPESAGPATGDFLHLDINAGIDKDYGPYGRFDINHLDAKTGLVITKLHGRINCIKTEGPTAWASGVITWGTIPSRPTFDPAGHGFAVTIRKKQSGEETFAIDLDFLPPQHQIPGCEQVDTDVVPITDGNFVML